MTFFIMTQSRQVLKAICILFNIFINAELLFSGIEADFAYVCNTFTKLQIIIIKEPLLFMDLLDVVICEYWFPYIIVITDIPIIKKKNLDIKVSCIFY